MWLFYFLFWIAVRVSAKEPLYRKIGDKAVLTAATVVNPITSIEWKHGLDIAMEWYGDELFAYRHFKDRGMLNMSNGALTITGLTPDDSGIYTVEINNILASKTELLVISPVSKPTLSLWCEPEMIYCVLTCSGNTTGSEPVTYRWTSGDMTWSSTKEHNITEEDSELWFSCAFENPVSFKSSEIVFNPFMEKEPLYMKIGDEAVFTPDSVVNPISSIVWKHGPDLAMAWYGDQTYSYRHFKDHGRLNTLTGVLTITRLTQEDSGNYTVEINNILTSKTELLVISPVSKPTISDWCAMTYCVFTCSGNTTGSEPVTYWWTSGDMTWPSTKEQKITLLEREMWYSLLSCAFDNPVSNISSEKVFNPFTRNLIIFVAILLLVVCVIIITFRHKGIIYVKCKCLKGVLSWMFIFIAVSLFIQVVCAIIIFYLDYKGSKEDITWVLILTAVFGVILVGCIIMFIVLIYKGRKGVLMWISIFIAVGIPTGCIITIISYMYKAGHKDLAGMLLLTAALEITMVGCTFIIIYLIYKGIIYFRRKRRERDDGEEAEPMKERSATSPDVTETATQD